MYFARVPAFRNGFSLRPVEVGFCLDTCHAFAAGEELLGVVERARALIVEKRQIEAALATRALAAEERRTLEAQVRDIGDLESLLAFRTDAVSAPARRQSRHPWRRRH